MAPHGLGQLAALVISHISGRSTDQTLHRKLLHVLGHVDTNQRTLIVKEELGQRLCQLGLTDAGGPQEEETAQRTVGIGQPRAASADCRSNRRHGFVLTNNAQMKLALKVLELVHLALHHLGHGHARPRRNHLGNLIRGNFLFQKSPVFLFGEKCFLGFIVLTLKLRNCAVAKLRRARKISVARGSIHLRTSVFHLRFKLLDLIDGAALVLPVCFHAVKLFSRCGNFFAQGRKTLL